MRTALSPKPTEQEVKARLFVPGFVHVTPVKRMIHTLGHPFCKDMECPCHTDEENLASISHSYAIGEITQEEYEHIFNGL